MRWLLLPSLLISSTLLGQEAPRWKAHDMERPRPAVVKPAAAVGQPPSDAIVLFDGTSLDAWESTEGGKAGWTVRDGYMETSPGAGAIRTKRGFGDIQLHVEWATPSKAEGNGQGRGNSGVIVMGRYEVQVLDSYGNTTYADGQAGAIYGQYPPMVNASRGPGEWQSYDIVFRRPRFAANGTVRAPARFTVFHNGVLIQDAETLWGPTEWLQHGAYATHADELPLVLQDHANPVRYRNVWVRPLGDIARPRALAASTPALAVPAATLQGYTGRYVTNGQEVCSVVLRGGKFLLVMPGDARREFELVPVTATQFTMKHTAGRIDFANDGGTRTIRLRFAEMDRTGTRGG